MLISATGAGAQPTPFFLPEYPRPDQQRAAWLNLNGLWQFRFAEADAGLQTESAAAFDREITVPFSGGAPLSGVPDEGDVDWYRREIEVSVPIEALRLAAASGELIVRLEVDDAFPHGLAIYGSQFGRYPVDPTLLLTTVPEVE